LFSRLIEPKTIETVATTVVALYEFFLWSLTKRNVRIKEKINIALHQTIMKSILTSLGITLEDEMGGACGAHGGGEGCIQHFGWEA
jgi:hypothetical protein